MFPFGSRASFRVVVYLPSELVLAWVGDGGWVGHIRRWTVVLPWGRSGHTLLGDAATSGMEKPPSGLARQAGESRSGRTVLAARHSHGKKRTRLCVPVLSRGETERGWGWGGVLGGWQDRTAS